jgi:pectate lyase
MTRASVLARGRTAAEAGMADACVIERRTGTATDDLTGSAVGTWATVYTGKCRIQQSIAMGQRTEAAEASIVVLRLELQLPVAGTEAVDRGHRVTVTACVNDAALVNRQFKIRDLAHKSEATARRMTIEELT